MSLPRHILNHSIAWLVLPVVVVLAIYVSIGRYFFPLLENYREDLVVRVNEHLPVAVQVGQLNGQWNQFDPFIQLADISIFSHYQSLDAQAAIDVEHFSLELDSLSTFRYQQPVIRQASIQGVTLRLQQQEDLSWILKGWEDFQAEKEGDSPAESENQSVAEASRQAREDVEPLAKLLQFLMGQQHLKMEYVWLEFFDHYGRQYRAFSNRIEVYDLGGKQRIQGSLQLDPDSAEQAAFIMEVSGDPFDQSSLEVDLYLQADPQPLSTWLEKIEHLLSINIPKLNAGIELWTRWKGGKLIELKGEVTAKELEISYEDRPSFKVDDFNGSIFWQREGEQDWQLILDQLSFNLQGQAFPMHQMLVDYQATGNHWLMQLADLNLASLDVVLQQLPELPDAAMDALKRLSPSGSLKNLMVSYSDAESINIRSELDRVSVEAYYGAPALRNVSGYLETATNKGYIQFHSDAFQMDFPKLYRKGWSFDQAQGRVDWEVSDKIRVFGQSLKLKKDKTDIVGEFDLLLHQESQKDLFYLNIGLTDIERELGFTLIPDRIVNPELTHWLNTSINKAKVTQGGFIYDGSLQLDVTKPNRQASTHLMLDVADGELKFLPQWPPVEALKARILLDGTELSSQVYSARYLGNDKLSGQVNLVDDVDSGSRVQLQLNGQLVPDWGWQVFTRTPLKTLIPQSLHHWQLSGPKLGLSTNLDFPINGKSGKGWVRVKTSNNQLLIPELNTPIKKLQSQIVYDLDNGLQVEQGQAELLSGDTRFNIQTDVSKGIVVIDGEGVVPLQALNRWQPMPFSPWLTGLAPYKYSMELAKTSELNLTSDLVGVIVDAPKPIGKLANESIPLVLNMQFSEEKNKFNVQYGQRVNAKGIWQAGGGNSLEGEDNDVKKYAANIWLGELPQKMLGPSGLTGLTEIHFRQGEVQAEPWIDFAKKEKARYALAQSIELSSNRVSDTKKIKPRNDIHGNRAIESSETESPVTTRFHLETDRVNFGRSQLNDLVLDAEQRNAETRLRFASQEVEGRVAFAHDLVSIELDHLYFEQDTAELVTEPKREGLVDQLFLQQWPDFDLRINEFQVNKIAGANLDVRYRTEREKRQLELKNLTQKSVHLSGILDWLIPKDKAQPAQSSLLFQVLGGDLADSQKAIDTEPMISSQKAQLDGRLRWQGLPHEFSSNTLSGQVNIELEKGEFEQVASAPALKLISLFNFESLVRRLQLDFSDLSGKGLSYDKVSGKVAILNGQGQLTEPLKVDGSATKFEMTGNIDFVNESFDQELIVTLPVAETLPLAAILAGAPQIGGTIYLAQKVLGNLFDKFTRARYSVTGAWDNPKIELKRVF